MSALGGSLDGLSVLDLFAGSGALGLEALSRGAAHVTFVERARGALRVLEANLALLGAGEEADVVAGDVFAFLATLDGAAYDVALADPPYGTGDAARLVEEYVAHPFARELWLEHPSRMALPVPDTARTRRYGDTSLTTLVLES